MAITDVGISQTCRFFHLQLPNRDNPVQRYLQSIREQELSQKEARESIDLLLSGRATPAQIGAFLFAVGERPVSIEEWVGFAQGIKRRKKRRQHASPSSILAAPLASQVADTCLASLMASREGVTTTVQTRTEEEKEAIQPQLQTLLPKFSGSGGGVKALSAEGYFPSLYPLFKIEEELGISSWLSVAAFLANSSTAEACLLPLPLDIWWEPVLHALRKLGVQQGVLIQQTSSDPSRYRIIHFQGIVVFSTFVAEHALAVEEDAKIQKFLGEKQALHSFALLQVALLLFLGRKVESIREGIERVREVITT